MRPLSRKFYQRHTALVARDLIGKMLVRQINGQVFAGVITETEAYTFRDEASHAFRGLTERNKAMFGPAGHAYVYFIYGSHFCLNVVAHTGKAGAVLIRSIKTEGRNTTGPGRLTKALCVDKSLYGADMTKKGEIFIADSKFNGKIMRTARIGITKATERKWRFIIN